MPQINSALGISTEKGASSDEASNVTIEGTEIKVARETDLEDISSTKTQLEIVPHEIEHLRDLVNDPKAFQKSVEENREVNHDFRPLEIKANKFRNEVIKEVLEYRERQRTEKQGGQSEKDN